MSGRWQQGFLRNAKWGTWQPPYRICPAPSPDKSEAVPLTDRWSPQLTDRAMCFMFSGRPEPAAAPAQAAEEEATLRDVWHKQPQRDRRTALMMGFFYMCHKLWGGQRWDALSVAHWAIFNLKTNKIICAWLTIHNKAGPAAVQTYDDEASIVVNRY